MHDNRSHTLWVGRLILGLLKGAFLGGAIGYGAFTLNLGGALHWVSYGLIGVVVGFLVGKPFWSHLRERGGTIFTPLLKGIVGYGIAVGIYAIVAKGWGGFDLEIAGETRRIYDWQHIMGAFIGAIYGGFVELDDAPESPPASKDKLQ